jgi:hypothetical protein
MKEKKKNLKEREERERETEEIGGMQFSHM